MSGDCGCGETDIQQGGRHKDIEQGGTKAVSPAAPNEPAAKTSGYGAPVHGDVSAPAAGVSVGGPIRRLNPANGLFLKAEHLDGIQAYSYALSSALGIAIGTGVVYGFGLTLDGGYLVATEGLALTPAGRPLQSSAALKLPLDDAHVPTLDPDGYWLVVVEPASELSGSENAYGIVCADPCEGVGSIKPWINSLVTLRLVPRIQLGLDAVVPDARRRNWLASQYFESERSQLDPWVVPKANGAAVGPLFQNAWAEGGTPPTEAAVPIGVLQSINGIYVLDTWTARREVSGPPRAVRWAGHLAMRPWPVFMAQVLQFEDQMKAEIASRGKSQGQKAVSSSEAAELQRESEEYFKTVERTPMKNSKAYQHLRDCLRQITEQRELNGTSLNDLGFGELPPAGYLRSTAQGVEEQNQIKALFADTVILRFCAVRADYVAGAVQAAQHLDRIPLDPDTDPKPEVDILVPSKRADLAALQTNDPYGWVAFVRHSPSSCTDEVPVYLAVGALDDVTEKLNDGQLPDDAQRLLTITYPKGQAQLPASVDRPDILSSFQLRGIVWVAPNSSAEALAKLRTEAIIEAWQLVDLETQSVINSSLQPLIVIFGLTSD